MAGSIQIRRSLTAVLAVSLAVLAGVAPLGLALHKARTMNIDDARDGLRAVAERIAASTSDLLTQIDQGLVALNDLSYRCTPDDIRALNNMAYDIPEISEIGLITPARKLVCSSWGVVEPAVNPGLPEPLAGFRLIGPVEIRIMQRYGLVALRLRNDGSEIAALIHPDILIGRLGADLGEHGFAVLIRRDDAHIYAQSGNVPEMHFEITDARLGDGPDSVHAKFSDGVTRTVIAVELDGFPGIYSVVAAADAWILRGWSRLALLMGFAGAVTSIVLVALVLMVFMRRLSLQGELERSLQKNEFEIGYLPVIELETGRCRGAEALISWRQPGGKRVRPDLFIPLAEDTGLIEPMTEWLMQKLLEEVGELLQRDRSLHVAINLSPSHFEDDRILQSSSAIFGNSGVMPEQLTYEITERSLIGDGSKALELMNTLKSRKSEIALDDFGTGYSSLSYIESFPLDYLKIDRRFVEAIGTDAPTAGLVDTIIEMATRLDLKIVAEGVETAAQVEYLTRRGVDFAQGWYFSRAVPREEFLAFVQARNRGGSDDGEHA